MKKVEVITNRRTQRMPKYGTEEKVFKNIIITMSIMAVIAPFII